MGNVYGQGEHMMVYISERFERSGRNAWLRAMANGKSLDEATREVFKMSFDDLDEAWRQALMETVRKKDAEKEEQETVKEVPPK